MKLLFLLFFICSSMMAITAEDAAWVLNTQTNFSKAMQQAKKAQKKMVLLVVVKDGCSWCEKMVLKTLSDPKIKKALTDTEIVVVDFHATLPQGLEVQLTPTMFFIDAQTGKVVQKTIGFEETGSFLIDIVSAKEKLP